MEQYPREQASSDSTLRIEPYDEGHVQVIANDGTVNIIRIGSLNLPSVHMDMREEMKTERTSMISKFTRSIISRLTS
jgi:hypothetical protein